MTNGACIGVDLGGTKIEVAVLSGSGDTLLRHRVPTPTGDYAATVATIAALVLNAEREFGASLPTGLGTPGSTDPKTGLIKNANSTVLIGKPLHRDVERALNRNVYIANDADCFILSEATDGAARGAAVAFGVILGTGVGGGIAVGGRIVAGANGIAGEWGHNPLPWPRADELPGPRCYCGKYGCIETWLCGSALARARAEKPGDEAQSDYEDRLARALATIVNVVDPHVIVLGGGVSNIGSLYENVPRLLHTYVFSNMLVTQLVRAKHGDSSGVRGAAMLALTGT